MWATCTHVLHMPKMIQIRHVPDELHKRLKVRAASAGMTLSDYLRTELEAMARIPTIDEMRGALAMLEPAQAGESAVSLIEAGRAERERQLVP